MWVQQDGLEGEGSGRAGTDWQLTGVSEQHDAWEIILKRWVFPRACG